MITEFSITDRTKAFFMEAGRGDLAERTTADCTHPGSSCHPDKIGYINHPHVIGFWGDDDQLIIEALYQSHKLAGHQVVRNPGSITCECFEYKGTW